MTLERDGTWHGPDGEELALHPGRGLLDCDVVFPVLHGPFGEDGTVQGLLELLGRPLRRLRRDGVSAVCMDKVVFKELMGAAGIPQVGYALVEAGRERPDLEALGFPLWVKPARLGSSVGIVRVERAEDIDAALDEAFAHDDRADRRGDGDRRGGRDVGARRHARRARERGPGEIVLLREGWYDYDAKYAEGGMRLQVPARISATAEALLKDIAARAFAAAGCTGPGPRGLLRRRRDRAAQRAQHAAGPDADVGLRRPLGALGRALPRGLRRALPHRGGALRARPRAAALSRL